MLSVALQSRQKNATKPGLSPNGRISATTSISVPQRLHSFI
jgi:hypothetical protein